MVLISLQSPNAAQGEVHGSRGWGRLEQAQVLIPHRGPCAAGGLPTP